MSLVGASGNGFEGMVARGLPCTGKSVQAWGLDAHVLFSEKVFKFLEDGGRPVFIAPERSLHALPARKLRELLARCAVEEPELVLEEASKGVPACPAVLVVRNATPQAPSSVKLRE
ncbi:MAG: hypothetical protein ABWK01_03265 [Infirmifilum sp.]